MIVLVLVIDYYYCYYYYEYDHNFVMLLPLFSGDWLLLLLLELVSSTRFLGRSVGLGGGLALPYPDLEPLGFGTGVLWAGTGGY